MESEGIKAVKQGLDLMAETKAAKAEGISSASAMSNCNTMDDELEESC